MKTKYHISCFTCAKSKLPDKSNYLTFCTFKNQNYNPLCLFPYKHTIRNIRFTISIYDSKKKLGNKTDKNLYLWRNTFPHNCWNDTHSAAKFPLGHLCPNSQILHAIFIVCYILTAGSRYCCICVFAHFLIQVLRTK